MLAVPDLINCGFELLGGVSGIVNIRQLIKDKEIKGVAWHVTLFFLAWGLWNLYFYSHLDQWLSFIAGIGLTITNLVWLVLLLYYTKRSPRDHS